MKTIALDSLDDDEEFDRKYDRHLARSAEPGGYDPYFEEEEDEKRPSRGGNTFCFDACSALGQRFLDEIEDEMVRIHEDARRILEEFQMARTGLAMMQDRRKGFCPVFPQVRYVNGAIRIEWLRCVKKRYKKQIKRGSGPEVLLESLREFTPDWIWSEVRTAELKFSLVRAKAQSWQKIRSTLRRLLKSQTRTIVASVGRLHDFGTPVPEQEANQVKNWLSHSRRGP